MTPETAIANLDTIPSEIGKHCAALAAECELIAKQWRQLGTIGGQRADHAAQLLARLRSPLAELTRFTRACEAQLSEMTENPFRD